MRIEYFQRICSALFYPELTLEQVTAIAKAGQNPQDSTLKKLANTSIKVIKGTIAALPSTATLVKACSELLPAIVHLLGL